MLNMLHKTKKDRLKPAKAPAPPALSRMRRALLVGGMMAFCTSCALLATISADLAFFIIGVCASCALVHQESQARQTYERRTALTIRKIEDAGQISLRETLGLRDELLAVERRLRRAEIDIKDIADSGSKPAALFAKILRRNAPANAPAQAAAPPQTKAQPKTGLQAQTPPKAVKAAPFSKPFEDAPMPRAMRPGQMLPSAKQQSVQQPLKPDAKPLPKNAKSGREAPVRNLVSYAGEDPLDEDYGLSDLVIEELIQYAVQEERIETFIQPICRLPQRRVHSYEIFSRLRARPGVYVPASRYLGIAHNRDLTRGIDRILLREALEMLRATASKEDAVPFFINITAASLLDKAFMNTLLPFAARARSLMPRLILELRQAEFEKLSAAAAAIMGALAKLGCRFSIDHVAHLNFDEGYLSGLGIGYIKIDAHTFLEKSDDDDAFAALRLARDRLQNAGIAVIADRIEAEKTLAELTDYDIGFGQGLALGRPDLHGAYGAEPAGAQQSRKRA